MERAQKIVDLKSEREKRMREEVEAKAYASYEQDYKIEEEVVKKRCSKQISATREQKES